MTVSDRAVDVASATRAALWRKLFPVPSGASDIPALDGLRAVAVGLVFIYHLWGTNPSRFRLFDRADLRAASTFGQMGVLLFFVLSGFLLFLPYARALHGRTGRLPDPRTFYRRRALRILPAYWVSLGLIVVLLKPALLNEGWSWQIISHVTFLYGFTFDTLHGINGVYWTLSIEAAFYVLLPFIGWLLARGRRPGLAVSTFVAVSVLLAVGWRVAFTHAIETSVDYRFYLSQIPALLCVFALGMGCSYVYVAYRPSDGNRRVAVLASLVGLVSLLVLFDASGTLRNPMYVDTAWVAPTANKMTFYRMGLDWDIVVALAWAGIIIGVTFGHRLWRQIFGLWPLRVLSLISYSFYLWHALIIGQLDDAFYRDHKGSWATVGLAATAFAIAFVFALAFYHLVERPFLHERRAPQTFSTTPPP